VAGPRDPRSRGRGRAVRRVGGAVACVLGVGAVLIWRVEAVRAVTVGAPPRLVHAPASPGLPSPDRDALGVAHNAGNSLEAAWTALAHGAEVVEVDVVRVGGVLRAGHDAPVPVVADALFRGPRVEDVWHVVRPRAQVKLDLKQTGDDDVRAVLAAVDRWTVRERTQERAAVVVTSRDPDAVHAVARADVTRRGDVHAFITLADRSSVRRLQADAGLRSVVRGVSVHHGLLDPATIGWLDAAGLDTIVWTVDDHARAHDLVASGVDGVTTDNLALLADLAGP